MYLLIKYIHITSVSLTLLFFIVRGIWMMQSSTWLHQRWIKIFPHIIDTLLLTSGITLAILIQQYPFVDTWLTAKFFGLILYIILGSIALKQGRTKTIRIIAWSSALVVFAYIVKVALSRLPHLL